MAIKNAVDTQAKTQDRLRYLASLTQDEILHELNTSKDGLSSEQVERSREEHGPNEVVSEVKHSWFQRIVEEFKDPFTLILLAIAVISFITDVVAASDQDKNYTTPLIIIALVLISAIMRFVQETKSGNAARALAQTIKTRCVIDRKNSGRIQLPISECVVGDIIYLSAGDMIPADLRIISAKDFFVSQSALTGESEPIEKDPIAKDIDTDALTDISNLAFLGSNVVSGSAIGVVCETGSNTLFGEIAGVLGSETQKTSFDAGIDSISRLLLKLMIIIAPSVFVINVITKGNWVDALLFSLSIAVGLTPEMLPMIVTTCLAKGAHDLSEQKVIVKKLESIQNLGSIDILCTDKTGTLTEDRVVLERHLDVLGETDSDVLALAYLNSHYETGLRNLIDTAILSRKDLIEQSPVKEYKSFDDMVANTTLIDELPFDFERRRVSVVLRLDDKNINNTSQSDKTMMITKGAIEEVLSISKTVSYHGKIHALDDDTRNRILEQALEVSDNGMRVLGVAYKNNPQIASAMSSEDETDMTFVGYLAFLDPPKESAKQAISALNTHGVTTKVLTGDSPRVAIHVCRAIGLDVEGVLSGSDIEKMTHEELKSAVEKTTIFAKLSPNQKSLVVMTLRDLGHTVGFMGDGVNDAPAMKASDCGISVDSATDVAKESANIILLEKDLMVLEKGIIEGRKTYANMNKYIKITASSNFGNIFSVLIASIVLPFLPMTAAQILLLNFIYDITCSSLPWDNVDQSLLKEPRTWNAKSIATFMKWMGPMSSIVDMLTFAILFFIICPMVAHGAWGSLPSAEAKEVFIGAFQAGWFIESMMTQTFIIHLLRTQKRSFIDSHASIAVTTLGLIGIGVSIILPYTTLGLGLGFYPLPLVYYSWLIALTAIYIFLVAWVKKLYIHKFKRLL